jgi:hypothetical protein
MGRVFFNTRRNVHALTTTYQVLASDSGKIFTLDSASGAYDVTLPTIEAGLFYKFIVKEDTPTADITIKSSTTNIDLVSKDSEADAGGSTAGSAATNIVVDQTAKQGTYVNIYSDGTGWYAESMGQVDAGIYTS